ncbi:hypothetical protein D3C87_1430270 [compost metagenome]
MKKARPQETAHIQFITIKVGILPNLAEALEVKKAPTTATNCIIKIQVIKPIVPSSFDDH